MRAVRGIGCRFIAASLLAVAFCNTPARASGDSTPVMVVVSARSVLSSQAKSALEDASGGHVVNAISPLDLVIRTAAGDLARLRATAARMAPGSVVQLDGRAHLANLPNDPCVTQCDPDWGGGQKAPLGQWALKDIHAPAAWEQTTGTASVLVAVVDSGVNGSVPELAGKVVREIDEIPGAPRNANHGTEVASIIAANTNNGAGIAGISWRSKILSIRVADQYGNVVTTDLAKGIRDAADAGASIINVSIGGPDQSFIADAVNYAESKGALVVAAASNIHSGIKIFPAAYPNVLSVSAVDQDNDNYEYSNGSWVDVYAPGEAVIGIAANGVPSVIAGTSFATPMVSGTAALLKTRFPNATPEALLAMITTHARTVRGIQTGRRIPLLDINAALSAKGGYWLAASDGHVRNEGTAPRYGDLKAIIKPIVGMAATPSGRGYWLVGSDGGIFTYGDARFHGSTGGHHLNQPIVGMAATPSGHGYWLVGSDGGIFTYGDARFHGSTGGHHLNQPIVGMAATPSGHGYWLVGSDGGIFTYGDARFHGSGSGTLTDTSVTGMTRTASGAGYWVYTATGDVLTFGDATQSGQPRFTDQRYVGLAAAAQIRPASRKP